MMAKNDRTVPNGMKLEIVDGEPTYLLKQPDGWVNKLSGLDIPPFESMISNITRQPSEKTIFDNRFSRTKSIVSTNGKTTTERITSPAGSSTTQSHSFGMPIPDPDYAFYGTITEEVLNRYLARAIDMQGLFMWLHYYDVLTGEDQGPHPGLNTTTTPATPWLPQGPGPSFYPLNPTFYPPLELNNTDTVTPIGTFVNLPVPLPGTLINNGFINFLDTNTDPSNAFTYLGEMYSNGMDFFYRFVLNKFQTNPNYPTQHGDDMAMLADLKPKLIMCTNFWGDFVQLDWVCAFSYANIKLYKENVDPDAIFMASVFEVTDWTANLITIPDWILKKFKFWPDQSVDPPVGYTHHYNTLYPTSPNNFDCMQMQFPAGFTPDLSTCPLTDVDYNIINENRNTYGLFYGWNGESLTEYDNSQVETQMWQFYTATKFIDAGFEAILFPVYGVDLNDPGHAITWQTMQYIREYAQSVVTNPYSGATGPASARNLVLLGSLTGLNNLYYDPQTVPATPILPNWQRQLLSDFNMNKIPYSRPADVVGCSGEGCYDGTTTYPANYPIVIEDTILNRPELCQNAANPTANYPTVINAMYIDDIWYAGGLHPQGWICRQLPCLYALDNAASDTGSGCCYLPEQWYYYADYGFEMTTWFALQSIECRNAILLYTHYKLKCKSPFNYWFMPGRDIIDFPLNPSPTYYYRANAIPPSLYSPEYLDLTGTFGQQETIKQIFNNEIPTIFNWVTHNFTFENVCNGSAARLDRDKSDWVPPDTALVCVGDDMQFFIGTDGLIHGYVRVSSNDYGGSWLAVSPSYGANGSAYDPATGITDTTQLFSSQVPAKASSLIVSPDNSMLLYIGIDGYIYGFNIIDPWQYHYITYTTFPAATTNSGFHKDKMFYGSELISADSCLIMPTMGWLYFIGAYGGGKNIYGLYEDSSGQWRITGVYDTTSGAANYQPLGALRFNIGSTGKQLCYVDGTNNFSYYHINDGTYPEDTTYTYISSYDYNTIATLVYPNPVDAGLKAYYNNYYFTVWNEDPHIHNRNIYRLNQNAATGSWTLVNLAALAGVSLVGIVYPESDNFALSRDGSILAYIGTKIVGGVTQYFVVLFSGLTSPRCTYSEHLINFALSGSENSLQFKDDNNLFFISNSPDLSNCLVYNVRYEEDYCNNPGIQAYLDFTPLPAPCVCDPNPGISIEADPISVTRHPYYNLFLVITINSCGANCRIWAVTYQMEGGPAVELSFTMDCLEYPYIFRQQIASEVRGSMIYRVLLASQCGDETIEHITLDLN